jgi:hypothetical protein
MTLKRTFLIVNLILLLSLTGCRGSLFVARPITSLKTSSIAIPKDEPSTVRRRDLTSSPTDIASISPAKAERLFEPLGDGQLGTAERSIEVRAEKPVQAEHFAEKPGKPERFVEPRAEGRLAKEERVSESPAKKVEDHFTEPLVEKRAKDRPEKPGKDKK